MNERKSFVDSLKGIATIGVILTHTMGGGNSWVNWQNM